MALCVIDMYTGKKIFMSSMYQVTAHVLWLCVLLICTQVRRYNQQLISDHYYIMLCVNLLGKCLNYFYFCIYILLPYSIVSYECFCQ